MKNKLIEKLICQPEVKNLVNFFLEERVEIRFVGGCIRDELIGCKNYDIDFSINCSPDETVKILNKNNIKYKDYGQKYGSIKAIINGKNFEITSLREDLNQKGRQTEVKFINNWNKDAYRRDFTMNAIYLSPNGNLYDYFNGKEDILNEQVRFIGNIEKRIQEDYLRIFRYYRFLGCFKRINIIDGYEDIIIKHIPKIREYINFDLMRNEILKMLKNKYAINSFIDINKPSDKNYLFKTISDLWNKEKYYLGINKCMNFVDEYF